MIFYQNMQHIRQSLLPDLRPKLSVRPTLPRAQSMHKARWSASVLCKWVVLASAKAASDRMDTSRPLLIVFGDSLSDQGNVFASTNRTEPHPRLYFQGRFTNNLCWADYLDHNVKDKAWEGPQWDVINYAYGGSTACGPSALYMGTPPLAAQVQTYIQGHLPLKDHKKPPFAEEAESAARRVADIVIMAGANDYLAKIIAGAKGAVDKSMEEAHESTKNALRLLPEQVVGCILEALREILQVSEGGYSRRGGSRIPSHTVRSILVASLPALEDTPFVRTMLMRSEEDLVALSAAESKHAHLLREGLQDLSAQQDSPLLSYLDVTSLTQRFFSGARDFGIVNVDDACLLRDASDHVGTDADMVPCQSDASELPLRLNPTTPPPSAPLSGEFHACCGNPEQHFFFDNVHPSSTIHFHAAQYIRAFLEGIS